MSLVDRLKNIFRKENERLMIALVPREVVAHSRLYKQPRGMVEEGDITPYFERSFEAFIPALSDAYGNTFEVQRETGDRKIGEVYSQKGRTVRYHIFGINDFQQSGDPKRFSTDITGILDIEEPQIDFAKAARLLERLSESHLLSYIPHGENGPYGLFYTRPNIGLVGGKDVLERLRPAPCEVAEYNQMMIYGGYIHRVLEAEGIIVEA